MQSIFCFSPNSSPTSVLPAADFDEWVQRGFLIESKVENGHPYGSSQAHSSLAMSSDGSVLAIGVAPWNSIPEIGADDTGYVEILKWNSTDAVDSVGSDEQWERAYITGVSGGDRFGGSIALSSDGTILVVGACRYVSVFSYDEDARIWDPLGPVISISRARCGPASLALSEGGFTLVVGEAALSSGAFGGVVRVFIYNNSTNLWNQQGSNLTGPGIDCVPQSL